MKEVLINNKRFKNLIALKSENSNKAFLNHMKECMSIELNKNDVVVDIGAYIGEYSVYAIDQGVKKVISYEATPSTFNVLNRNKRGNMIVNNLAVVYDDRKKTKLHISKGIGVTNSIVKSARKSHFIEIDCIKYDKAVKEATVVKIDVEGAEYDYNIIHDNLRAIILEFHPINNIDWKKNAKKIIQDINNAGFKTIIEPTFKSGWNLTGSFLR